MKKIVVLVFSIFMSTLALFGQVEGINIYDAVNVTTSDIQFSKPIKITTANQIITSPEMITFDFPKCDLRIGNGIASPVGGGSGPAIMPTGTVTNPALMNYGFVYPSVTNYMDLGSANFRFRNVYIKQLFATINPTSLSDARYKENIEDLEEAETKLMALRPVSFDFIITDSM